MLLKLLIFLSISLGITLALALGLILSQSSQPRVAEGLDFSRQVHAGRSDPAPLTLYQGGDGARLGLRSYPSGRADAPLLVLVHGSGWHGLAFDPMAAALADQGIADVLVPDLRGHGAAPARRGDIDYIGQLEDDLHALITQHRSRPDQPVVMAGHSSGGGLVIRYAGGDHGTDLTAALLLAPFLKYNAPTARTDSPWATPLTRRLIGLSILNALRIRLLNHLTVIDFAFPAAVLDGPLGNTATRSYSYRLNTSFAPRRDYLSDVAALPRFLLLAGHQDEAFRAEQYQPTLSAVTDKGSYTLFDGMSHLDILTDPRAIAAMASFVTAQTSP